MQEVGENVHPKGMHAAGRFHPVFLSPSVLGVLVFFVLPFFVVIFLFGGR